MPSSRQLQSASAVQHRTEGEITIGIFRHTDERIEDKIEKHTKNVHTFPFPGVKRRESPWIWVSPLGCLGHDDGGFTVCLFRVCVCVSVGVCMRACVKAHEALVEGNSLRRLQPRSCGDILHIPPYALTVKDTL